MAPCDNIRQGPVIQRSFIPVLLSVTWLVIYVSPWDRLVIQRTSIPRLLSQMAPYDVASISARPCGKGFTSVLLAHRYPKARILMFDKNKKINLSHLAGRLFKTSSRATLNLCLLRALV